MIPKLETTPTGVCIVCGRHFPINPKTKRKLYCSVVCRKSVAYKKRPKHACKCTICGKSFESHRVNAKYCSQACLRRAIALRKNPNAKPKQAIAKNAKGSIQCRQCGKYFIPRTKTEIYCSAKCGINAMCTDQVREYEK